MSYENSTGSGLLKIGIVVFHILFEAAENWHSPPKVWIKTVWQAPCGPRNRIRLEEDTSIEEAGNEF
jgi:hypothetical protein